MTSHVCSMPKSYSALTCLRHLLVVPQVSEQHIKVEHVAEPGGSRLVRPLSASLAHRTPASRPGTATSRFGNSSSSSRPSTSPGLGRLLAEESNNTNNAGLSGRDVASSRGGSFASSSSAIITSRGRSRGGSGSIPGTDSSLAAERAASNRLDLTSSSGRDQEASDQAHQKEVIVSNVRSSMHTLRSISNSRLKGSAGSSPSSSRPGSAASAGGNQTERTTSSRLRDVG